MDNKNHQTSLEGLYAEDKEKARKIFETENMMAEILMLISRQNEEIPIMSNKMTQNENGKVMKIGH